MPNVPVPCTNCLRFHYGVCREPPRQCFGCGVMNHIERYCPCNRRLQVDRGEPLPGTRAWCNNYCLDKDPDLKLKILNTIKTSPGCAVWLEGVRIYRGNERHFYSDYISRGRTYDHRPARRRSRSPLRDGSRSRSPSPVRGRSPRMDHFGYDIAPPHRRNISPYHRRRYRSRSPLRRELPSPNQQPDVRPRSPGYSRGSNTVVYEAKNNLPKHNKQAAGVQRPQSPKLRRPVTGLARSPCHPEARLPLSSVTNTHSTARKEEDRTRLAKRPTSKGKERSKYKSASDDFHVDDPHFVLGIIEGAAELE